MQAYRLLHNSVSLLFIAAGIPTDFIIEFYESDKVLRALLAVLKCELGNKNWRVVFSREYYHVCSSYVLFYFIIVFFSRATVSAVL